VPLDLGEVLYESRAKVRCIDFPTTAIVSLLYVLLTQTIAFENARHGIRANVISPGWVRTEMGDMEMRSLADGDADAGYRLVTKLVPQRRPGDPKEIANAVAWLLSPQASYMNGAVITVDGGAASVCAAMTAFDAP
jgi:NAD(P)-dependent dehydrogenase (short-subunit alcohol dehydrogenase family)